MIDFKNMVTAMKATWICHMLKHVDANWLATVKSKIDLLT